MHLKTLMSPATQINAELDNLERLSRPIKDTRACHKSVLPMQLVLWMSTISKYGKFSKASMSPIVHASRVLLFENDEFVGVNLPMHAVCRMLICMTDERSLNAAMFPGQH